MVQGEYMENLLSIKKKSFFPGLTLLLAGFLAGMLIPNFIYRFSWKQQAFSAVYLLETYGKTEAGGIDYLLQILWMRGGIFFLSLICGFTVFGVPMAIMAMLFTGIGLGIVFSMSILQFGLTGGAVAVALLFPHYLIYLPTILFHAKFTLLESFYGLLIGIALAFVFATMMDRFRVMDQAFYPIMIITQTIPTIAIAPILVLWMGFGMAPKITLVVITTFFPITIGLLDGYKSVDPDAIRLMKAMGASRAQIFRHVKFPGALPQFFSGLKISASYAVVGAVVSEWLGGFNGLGVYMTRVKKAYSFDKMFAVIIFIVIISLLLLLAVNIVSRITMPWLQVEKEKNHE